MADRPRDPADLVIDLARALLDLTGRHLDVTLEIPGGRRPLHFEGVLHRPFDEPFGPESLTLGFCVDAQRLDLRLTDVVDIRTRTATPARVSTATLVSLHLILADGATLILTDPSLGSAPEKPSTSTDPTNNG